MDKKDSYAEFIYVRDKLGALRTTDSMNKAQEVYGKAFDNLGNAKRELNQATILIGEGSATHPLATNDLSKAFREFANRGKNQEKKTKNNRKIFHAPAIQIK